MKEAEMVIPHLFRCPISLDLFMDPVTLSTGQTYDRPSIEKWLATGNLTCPVTMQKLHDPSMVPNHTLRHLIDQWIQKGHHLSPDHLNTTDPEFSLISIRHNLESHEVSVQKKLQILDKIEALSDELPCKNYCFIQLGLFSLLLELVFGKVEGGDQQYPIKFVEKALFCVVKLLRFTDFGSLNVLKEEFKVERFLLLFDQGNGSVKKSLCQIVEVISSSFYTKDLSIIFGEKQSLIQGIVRLIHDNPDDDDDSESAIRAISALCSLQQNRENLVRADAIHGLVTYILGPERPKKLLAPMAIKVLDVLARSVESAKMAIIDHPNGVNTLVKMVFRVSDHGGSYNALSSLMILCYDSSKAREEAIRAGVLTQLLLLLQSQCSERTKTKARMLLKLLRSMWSEDQKHC